MPYVHANDIDIHYTEAGEGEPLLLIMGITAPGSGWAAHAASWKAHFRCIMPDNRGVGFTDKPAGPYSSAQMADDMAGLLNEVGLRSVPVVGLSMGAAVAQQLALRHPENVDSLVLMCPWARCDRYAKALFRHMTALKARLRPEEFMAFMQLLIYAKATWDSGEAYAAMQQAREEAAQGPYPQPLHGLEGQAIACLEHDVLADLQQIGVPTLVLGGADDRFIPSWMSEEVAERIPDCEIRLYPGTGHAFHFERVEEVNEKVLEWLRARA